MSTYDLYLGKAREEEFLNYQETKNYLDELIKQGIINNYDESLLKNLKTGITGLSLLAILNPFNPITANNIKNSKNIQTEINNVIASPMAGETKYNNPKYFLQIKDSLANLKQIEKDIKENISEKEKQGVLLRQVSILKDILEKQKIAIESDNLEREKKEKEFAEENKKINAKISKLNKKFLEEIEN